MYAKVSPDARFSTITAFGGHEFSKAEYRIVPAGFEADAEAHPMLVTVAELEVQKQPEPVKISKREAARLAKEQPDEEPFDLLVDLIQPVEVTPDEGG